MSAEPRESLVGACALCEGAGCSDCGYTGKRVTTVIDAGDGITARVSGNAPLSAESRDALAQLMRAAFEKDVDR